MSETTGIGRMEAAADAAIAAQAIEAAAIAAHEARINSPEVQLLNDTAEIEIFGPKPGRTYTGPVGPGVLEDLRTNRRYGRTAAERENAATFYEGSMQAMLDDGFELCQAKVVLDMAMEDRENHADFIAKQISAGLSATEAEAKANAVYTRKGERRRQIIKDNDLFTRDDYERFIGEGSTAEKPVETPAVVTPEVELILNEQVEALNAGRSVYARASAEAQRKATGRFLLGDQKRVGKLIRKSERLSGLIDSVNTRLDAPVREAREQYEHTLDELGAVVAHLSREAGVSQNEIRNLAFAALCEEANQLALETANVAMELAGGNVDEADRSRLSKRQLQFAGWWARNSINSSDPSKSNKLGLVKKGAVMAGVGLAVGTGVGLVGVGAWAGSVIGGGVAGALARNVNRKQAAGIAETLTDDDGNVIGELTSAQRKAGQAVVNMQQSVHDSFIDGTDAFARAGDITRVQEHSTDQEMLGNRRRIRLAFAAGSLGARAGVTLGNGIRHTVKNVFGNGSGKSATSEGTTTTSSTSTTTTSAPKNGNPLNWSPKEMKNFERMNNWYHNRLNTGATEPQIAADWANLFK